MASKLLMGLMVLTITISSVVSIPIIVRHLNPYTVKEDTPPINVLLYFNILSLDLLSNGNFTGSIVKLKKLSSASIPSSYKYLIDRITGLTNKTNLELKTVSSDINKSKELIDLGNLSSAVKILRNDKILLEDANLTLSEIVSGFSRLNALLFVRDRIDRARSLIEKYFSEVNEMLGYASSLRLKEKTMLMLKISNASIPLGSYAFVYGTLKGEKGELLNKRRVDFYFNNIFLGYSITKSGAFNFTFKVPFIYNKMAYLYGIYRAINDSYLPTYSRIIVKLKFLEPKIHLSYPRQVYPGKVMEINGFIKVGNEYFRNASFLINAFNEAFNLIAINGSFSLKISVPASIKSGEYTIAAYSAPRKIIGPSRALAKITVVRGRIGASITYPSIVFGYSLLISGRISFNGRPVKNATVIITGDLTGSSKTNLDGYFKEYFRFSYLTLSGKKTLHIFIKPNEPWLASKHITINILYVNPITLSIVLAVIIAILAWRGTKPQAKKVKKIERKEIALTKQPTGIPDVYSIASSIVERITGIKNRASYTIREYLRLVASKLGRLSRIFKGISIIAEIWLYSRNKRRELYIAARKLLERMRSESS